MPRGITASGVTRTRAINEAETKAAIKKQLKKGDISKIAKEIGMVRPGVSLMINGRSSLSQRVADYFGYELVWRKKDGS